MPSYLRGATVDYGFARLAHAQKRALVPFIGDDGFDDHTIETMTAYLERASAAAGGVRIEAAMVDELDSHVLVVVENGKTDRISVDASDARHRELSETTTEELVGETFGATLTFGLPNPLGERVDAWRMNGGSPTRLVAEIWQRAYPSIAKLEPFALARVLARFPETAKRTKIVATVDALTHFDMLHEAARLQTKLSPLVLYAFVEHGGHRLIDTV